MLIDVITYEGGGVGMTLLEGLMVSRYQSVVKNRT